MNQYSTFGGVHDVGHLPWPTGDRWAYGGGRCGEWLCGLVVFYGDHDCDDGDDADGGDDGDGDEDQLTWFVPGRKRKDRLWRIRQDASEGVTRDQCEK